jgi:hypothetical protein
MLFPQLTACLLKRFGSMLPVRRSLSRRAGAATFSASSLSFFGVPARILAESGVTHNPLILEDRRNAWSWNLNHYSRRKLNPV